MKYILAILLSVSLFGQNVFTDEQVVEIANKIKKIEQSDSLKTVQIEIYEDLIKQYEEQSKIDSSLILKKDEQIELLKEQNETLEEQIKLVEPKWYESKWLYFIYGAVSIIIPTYFGIKIVDLAK